MSIVTLQTAFSRLRDGGALAGLVCLGWEEVRAYIRAAEAAERPTVLMVGPGARASMPLNIWGAMLVEAASASSADIVIHLDHGKSVDEVKAALDAGFSSVMYDGSLLPLAENIKHTKAMVDLAKSYGASTEAELGQVGYVDGAKSSGTDVDEVRVFLADCDIDCLAVSVGNTHLQKRANANVDWERLAALAAFDKPLVIHGGSGILPADRIKMAREFNVRKFNIGTELRQVFGAALRQKLDDEPTLFDHIQIMSAVDVPLMQKAATIISELGGGNE